MDLKQEERYTIMHEVFYVVKDKIASLKRYGRKIIEAEALGIREAQRLYSRKFSTEHLPECDMRNVIG